jgi:hypothetical protein
MRTLTITAALLAAAAFSVPAQAGHYLFQYDGNADYSDVGSPMSATIHFITSSTLNALGGYDILSATGVIDGNAILGLEPNPNQPDQYGNGFYIYDNVLFASGPALDAPGVVVNTASLQYNFGYDPDGFTEDPANPYYGLSSDGTTHINPVTGHVVNNYKISIGNASLTEEAVPEPASWALMVAGFGLAGSVMRRRMAVSFA